MILSHNDDPTLHDGFDNKDFIKEVCLLIKKCRPPKGIGLNGYWGTGKTSALLQVYFQLSGKSPYNNDIDTNSFSAEYVDESIIPIWFEAWRYQYEGQPIVALLNEIRHQMGMFQKFTDSTKKIAGVTILGALSVFDEVIKVASGGLLKHQIDKVQTIGDTWEKERYQQHLPGQTINKLLQEAINSILPEKDNPKLAIFIDDLDRCEPESALRLMEGIKVYLNLDNCVVIFGLDQRQIERALIKALGLNNHENDEHYAREYLEKICQDIIHLPLAGKKKKSDYFSGLLKEVVGEPKHQFCVEQIIKVTSMYDCLPANPRKIKALSNRIASMFRQQLSLEWENGPTFSSLGEEQDETSNLDKNAAICLIVAILYCFHRAVYEQLQKSPEYISTVVEYASSQDLNNEDYLPMRGIKPSMSVDKELPVNPSDSNVFRLHQLLIDLRTIGSEEILLFTNL
ncbi:P-loop NTPase fold protein [Desulfogranum marinum]|uniref:KAP family P-loop NTPase fold protein n=1 Tax=Desulfogranum marinum TaxID=453220 RepID=UPI0029C913BB|nr:P-loop NTPase fold protein [Desulfogranum marinum]